MLYRNAYALMTATVLSSLLGMAYWALAARMYDTETVGRASAVVSAMLLLCNAAQLNLSVGLMRFLPVAGARQRHLTLTSYSVAATAGLLAATGFLLVAPQVSQQWRFVAGSGELAALFVVGVGVWVVFALQDAALTGLRAALWVPVENVVFGLFKLLLLVALVSVVADTGILYSWVLSMAVMLIPVNWLIFRRLLPAQAGAPPADGLTTRSMARFIGGDYVGTLLSHTSTTALPLVVIAIAGPEQSAVFFVAWTLGAALDFIATGTASSFLVEGSAHQESAHDLNRAAARRAAALLLPAAALTALLADPLLRVFGEDYRQGRWVVVLLCAAAIPRMFLLLRLAALRVERRVASVVRLQALACVCMLGLSTAALQLGWGLTAVAAAWLVTQSGVLAVASLDRRSTLTAPTPAAAVPSPPAALATEAPARTRD